MSPALTVSLNRDRLHDIEVARTYSTDETFYVELQNHGEAVHIHLHLDDTLSAAARLDAGNHYVGKGATEVVRVDVDHVDHPVTGKLKIVTGYGAETAYVDVTIEPYAEEKHFVQVDESLGKPKRDPNPEPETESTVDRLTEAIPTGSLPLVGFALVAIALALAIAVVVDSTPVFVGVGVVIGGVLAALAMQVL